MASLRCIDCGGDAGEGTQLVLGTWMQLCDDCALKMWEKVKDDPP